MKRSAIRYDILIMLELEAKFLVPDWWGIYIVDYIPPVRD
jgi:hypothetical protein